MIERMVSVKELAAILNVPVSWIYERTRKGSNDRIPHVRIGKYIRFPEEMIRDFVEKHKRIGDSD